ncbi:MAG: biotin--[acetyl-CoA-carboxylase] ligase [Acidobacteria bacterium]|nr:MAG: biotin--[acetyl-CoA-carboxylase] ligase [Acidobacteriota bacterium]
MRHATVVVSGTKVAQEIGTTRSEIWRLIQQLRRLGVEIAGHPATGYQLRAMPDLLLPEILSPLVRGTLFENHLHHFYKIGSTNVAAMEAAAAAAPDGTVLLAEEQTAGRGRGNHAWHSARSAGIYCSAIVRPALPPADVLILSLAAGLAVQSAVEEVGNARADLRWPNDLLLDGKKFCGILTEMTAEATRVRHVVVGIGINVNHASFPGSLQSEATSLRLATGTEWSRVELTAALLKSLDREYKLLISGPSGRDSILRRFAERSSYVRGKNVHVDENGGFDGVTEGLDTRGFLQVRTPQGLRTVLSGAVRPR